MTLPPFTLNLSVQILVSRVLSLIDDTFEIVPLKSTSWWPLVSVRVLLVENVPRAWVSVVSVLLDLLSRHIHGRRTRLGILLYGIMQFELRV